MSIIHTITIFVYSIVMGFSWLSPQQNQVTIMLDPAGHARNTGRRLVNNFERAETLKLAESLRAMLESRYNVKVILTRSPGEEIVPLQNASFANRLAVDFFLSLHIYKEESVKPKVFLYQHVYNPVADFAQRIIDPLAFIPIHQAHFLNIHKTTLAGKMMNAKLIQSDNQKLFDFYGLFGIPLKPLVGITSPALLLEIGVNEDNKWQNLIEPLVESCSFLQIT